MKLTLAFLVGFLLLSSCTREIAPPGDGPVDIPFDLIYPQPAAPASYLGVSGHRLITTEDFRDTVILVTSTGFFAQFTAQGAALPASVELDGIALERHLETDTLRFNDTPVQTSFGAHTWRLTEASGAPVSFTSQAVQIVDSVAPLFDFQPRRSDTSLTLTWKPPTSGSHGILITWRAGETEPFSQIVSDLGRFVIPAAVVGRFKGESELTLTRFRTDSHTYLGKQLFLTRVAQRNYKVTVTG